MDREVLQGIPDRSPVNDIVEHSDPAVRECERAALLWWLRQAELVLETGLV